MSNVSSADRLSFTLFMAAAVHAAIVLGISFGLQDKTAPPTTLEVTLATYRSEEKPDQADYLAQFHQQGSGTLDEKAKPQTDQKAEFQSNQINEVELRQQEAASPKQVQPESPQVTTRAEVDFKTTDNAEEQPPVPEAPEHDVPHKRIDLREEIASLEALFSDQRQAYANRPKIKRLTAASTMQEPGAYYKETWRRKVERVGNMNYPAQARQQKLFGELRLMVSINRDGTLYKVKILKSSGSTILDDAAIRIVKLAAPYAPFGSDLRNYDRVEIIRTWRFERGNRMSSH